jgi:hypothetical protein
VFIIASAAAFASAIFLIVSYTYSQYFILPILRINFNHVFQRLRVERVFFLNTRLADFLYLREGRRREPPPLPLGFAVPLAR